MTPLLAWALPLFMAATFALPGEAAYALVFYVAVLPCLLLAWRRQPPFEAGDYAALALIAWSGLTLLWGEDPTHRDARFLVAMVATAAFFLALRTVLADPPASARLAAALVWAGTANAAFLLLASCRTLFAGGRILGWGITNQPILGASVLAVCMLTSLSRAISARSTKPRALHAAATALTAVAILALQSRGALLAASAAALLLLVSSPWRRPALATVLAGAAAWVLLAPRSLRNRAAQLFLARGDSHRLDIWQRSLEAIRQKPLFGHGLAANLPPDNSGFPHSLYLSLLFYSGIVGLALFAALAGLVTRRLHAHHAWIAALWLNALLAGLTDFGQITKGPGELWLILWLPVALALSRHPTRSNLGPSCSNHCVAASRCGDRLSASSQNRAL